jgi:hypothetical protein
MPKLCREKNGPVTTAIQPSQRGSTHVARTSGRFRASRRLRRRRRRIVARMDRRRNGRGGGVATMATLDVRSRSLRRSLIRPIPLNHAV